MPFDFFKEKKTPKNTGTLLKRYRELKHKQKFQIANSEADILAALKLFFLMELNLCVMIDHNFKDFSSKNFSSKELIHFSHALFLTSFFAFCMSLSIIAAKNDFLNFLKNHVPKDGLKDIFLTIKKIAEKANLEIPESTQNLATKGTYYSFLNENSVEKRNKQPEDSDVLLTNYFSEAQFN